MYKWSAPKKGNDRAWKRIEAGEWYWNRRKTRGGPDKITLRNLEEYRNSTTHKAFLRRWPATGSYRNGYIDMGS
jgi:hypothetical protein